MISAKGKMEFVHASDFSEGLQGDVERKRRLSSVAMAIFVRIFPLALGASIR